MNASIIRLFRPLGVALALFTAGCSSVFVSRPVGEKPHVLDPNVWAGTWLTDEGKAVSVLVTDGAKGELQITGLEINIGEVAVKNYKVQVRESAGWLFASLRGDDAEKPGYLWARVKRADDQVIVWGPDVPAFRALVRDGKLKGKAPDSGDVELEQMPAEALTALTSGTLGVPFEWDSPFVLRRAGR